MKNTFKITLFSILILIGFLMTPFTASAKGFGTEESTYTQPCGECDCTYVHSETYIFWIKVGSSTMLTSIDC